MEEGEHDETTDKPAEQQLSPVSRLNSLSRRDLLKIGGAGVVGSGAAYLGVSLTDDQPVSDDQP